MSTKSIETVVLEHMNGRLWEYSAEGARVYVPADKVMYYGLGFDWDAPQGELTATLVGSPTEADILLRVFWSLKKGGVWYSHRFGRFYCTANVTADIDKLFGDGATEHMLAALFVAANRLAKTEGEHA